MPETRVQLDEKWKARARCAGVELPENFFYPEPGAPLHSQRAYCSRCPVQTDCLEYALAHHEAHGFWGGTTARERRRMLRARGG